MPVTIELEVFSPRWGHTDTYEVELTHAYMEISLQMKKSRLNWVDDCDPEWVGESLESIMGNDSIYPPAILPDLLEYAWKAWRNGELTEQEVSNELLSIAEWINTVTEAKPRSEFWRTYF